jgi:hypothetical protein
MSASGHLLVRGCVLVATVACSDAPQVVEPAGQKDVPCSLDLEGAWPAVSSGASAECNEFVTRLLPAAVAFDGGAGLVWSTATRRGTPVILTARHVEPSLSASSKVGYPGSEHAVSRFWLIDTANQTYLEGRLAYKLFHSGAMIFQGVAPAAHDFAVFAGGRRHVVGEKLSGTEPLTAAAEPLPAVPDFGKQKHPVGAVGPGTRVLVVAAQPGLVFGTPTFHNLPPTIRVAVGTVLDPVEAKRLLGQELDMQKLLALSVRVNRWMAGAPVFDGAGLPAAIIVRGPLGTSGDLALALRLGVIADQASAELAQAGTPAEYFE